jgi:hypothetical protein
MLGVGKMNDLNMITPKPRLARVWAHRAPGSARFHNLHLPDRQRDVTEGRLSCGPGRSFDPPSGPEGISVPHKPPIFELILK